MQELKPLQMLHELYDDRVMAFGERALKNEAAVMRRWKLLRALGKLGKPLLRFENLLGVQKRMALELASSQSVNMEIHWALHPLHLALKEYIERLFECEYENKRPLAWLEWCVSTDLLYAFDAQPMCSEGLVAILLLLNPEYNLQLIDIGEAAGVPSEYCSASKNAVGAALGGQLPTPDCIVTSSHPCDSIVSSYQSLEYLSRVPTFRLDTPYWDDARSVDFYAQEMKDLVAFLEKNFNKKLDYDRLREVIDDVNKTNNYMMEVCEMYANVPCPGSIFSTVFGWVARILGQGTPLVTECSRRLHQVTRKRVENGLGTIKNEKIRVIWLDVPIAYYPIVTWMEETFGAVIVTDIVTFLKTPDIDTSTNESMLRGLGESYMNLAMARQFHGPIELFMRDLTHVCETFSGDCFIFAGHQGCKHIWASTKILADYLKEIEMPLLLLSTDIFDRRVTHEDQVKRQITEFFVSNGLA